MATNSKPSELELWAGMECTINRVGDQFRDQLLRGGHYSREGDMERLVNLNIKALRYPILWEYYQPCDGQRIDWSRAENDIGLLRQAGVKPIVGLLHHGSGPIHTNLLDPEFADKFRAYAHAVATRFPEVEYYTPVNEPLTTARFSGMYGHWYPHHQNPRSFVQALLTQVKAVVCAMQAIRSVNPEAKLVQTEDLGKTHSTPMLEYQARFENERRWLTFDLLCGRVDEAHPLWGYIVESGIDYADLTWFLDNTCPPDIAGFNYYVTSERFLDENTERYPWLPVGGNERQQYIDTEAVRTSGSHGLKTLLTEAWDRLRLPMAITEAHLACTREEQMRWFKEMWDTVNEVRKTGIPVKAVTAWTTFGAYDWDSLLTIDAGHYEPGAFDVRHGVRPTAMAGMLRSLGSSADYQHPLLLRHGWWNPNKANEVNQHILKNEQPILLIGRDGTLATAFQNICRTRNIGHVALSRSDCDVTSDSDVQRAIDRYKPWAIINTAGYVDVDRAETDTAACEKLNADGPARIAMICGQKGIRYMTFSSDLVFDGNKGEPYDEQDETSPINQYGRSKARAETSMITTNPSTLIIRTSAFFGPWDRANFAYRVLDALQKSDTHFVVNDVTVSPTYVPHLVHAALDLFIDEAYGIWHIANDGKVTWADFAYGLADRQGLDKRKLIERPLAEMQWEAPRPKFSALRSVKGISLPSLDHAMAAFIHDSKL